MQFECGIIIIILLCINQAVLVKITGINKVFNPVVTSADIDVVTLHTGCVIHKSVIPVVSRHSSICKSGYFI